MDCSFLRRVARFPKSAFEARMITSDVNRKPCDQTPLLKRTPCYRPVPPPLSLSLSLSLSQSKKNKITRAKEGGQKMSPLCRRNNHINFIFLFLDCVFMPYRSICRPFYQKMSLWKLNLDFKHLGEFEIF